MTRVAFETWCDKYWGSNAYLHKSETCGEWAAWEAAMRECIDQCQNVGTVIEAMYDGEEARRFKAVADDCAKMIKLRFGVAE